MRANRSKDGCMYLTAIRKFLIAAVCVGFLVGGGVVAKDANVNAGTSGFSFLKINIGARAVGMGGAFTGLADDETALYYNPAGIASMEGDRYIAGYHNYFVDLQSGVVGYLHEIRYGTMIGGYISYLDYGDFTETDEVGNELGEFGGGDMVFAISAATSRGESYKFGATMKFIYEKLDEYSATGVALDVGARYNTFRSRYTAGVAIQNLGFQLSSLGEEKDRLPLTFRVGGSADPRGLPIVFSGDVIIPVDNDVHFAVGG
ncbi:PorV/PorQ family protein, partial [candidate division GN15 bacterium]|nr:PorV/PorQ family protein [candidate division GN15 bacterium]